jgi:hypothetical protein
MKVTSCKKQIVCFTTPLYRYKEHARWLAAYEKLFQNSIPVITLHEAAFLHVT